MLDKNLPVEDLSELRDAFELDKQREKDLKKEAKKGNWLCKTGDENKELLREIHEHAIKVQSKIAKELEKKVMKPVKDNQFAKVSRNHPFHYCLAFVSSVRQHPLAKMLTRVAQNSSSQCLVGSMRCFSSGPMPHSSTELSFS
jgi:hypothetical protein